MLISCSCDMQWFHKQHGCCYRHNDILRGWALLGYFSIRWIYQKCWEYTVDCRVSLFWLLLNYCIHVHFKPLNPASTQTPPPPQRLLCPTKSPNCGYLALFSFFTLLVSIKQKHLQTTQNTQNYFHIYFISKHFFKSKTKKHPSKHTFPHMHRLHVICRNRIHQRGSASLCK